MFNGKRLKEIRTRMGFTRKQLASRSGVPFGTLQDMEQGKSLNPHIRAVAAIADVVSVRMEELLTKPS